MAEKSFASQLIDQHGHFSKRRTEAFKKALSLDKCGLSYAVVSIMGPQSSGKSTLLNLLFRTNFREMEAFEGKSQTTKGIWSAKGVDIDPCTIVLDLEGSDGNERGEDDTIFEKQSALFALAVSDIMLINLWDHDIGRESAANKPLLKKVLQVMTRLFEPRKMTLLFVIRDISKTPLEILEQKLREDMQKIWDSVHKPEVYREIPLGELCKIEVVALSHYEYRKEQFMKEVASLRQRFYHSIAPGGLIGDQQKKVPAADFFFSAQRIWKHIKKNKDLDLPAHSVMVANIRCQQIAKEKSADFSSDEEWRQLEKDVQHGLMPHFGQTLSRLLDKFLSGYDMEAQYFDDHVKTEKRTELESELLQLASPAYESMLSHLRSKTLDDFKEAFDKALQSGEGFAIAVRGCTQSLMSAFEAGCEEAFVKQSKWDCLKVREKIRRDIDDHVASVHAKKLPELQAKYEGQLNKALVEPLEVLLAAASDDTWPAIRELVKRETESALSGLSPALCAFDIDPTTTNELLDGLERCARNVVENKMREEVARVSIRMKDRFLTMFTHDLDAMPKIWTVNEDITAITRNARSAALKLLSLMAVIRMDDNIDNIGNTLSQALLSAADNGTQSDVILASSSWEKVPPTRTLITPVRCKSLWRQFIAETDIHVTQAIATQEVQKTRRVIEAHVASVRAEKLSELKAKYEGQLNKALVEPVEVLLDAASDDTWPAIRELLKRETESALSGVSTALRAFDIDPTTTNELLDGLERCARNVVENKMREEVARVSIRMKDRFLTMFTHDLDAMPRIWTENEDITAITRNARSAALKLLSVMAAIRMDDNIDNIGNTLSLALLSAADNGIQSDVILASSSWEKVPPTGTLITPMRCPSLWRQFIAETDVFVTQAIATQEANRRNEEANRRNEEENRRNEEENRRNRGNRGRPRWLGRVGVALKIVSLTAHILSGGLWPHIG